MGAAAGIGPDQHPPPQPLWRLRERQNGHLNVLTGRAGSGAAGPQHDAQRFPASPGAVIGERGQDRPNVFFQAGAAFSFSAYAVTIVA
jgi:hypothetical protein